MKTITYNDNGGKKIIAHIDGPICGDSLIITWNKSQNSQQNHLSAATLLAEQTTRTPPIFASKSHDASVYNWKFN